LACISGKSPTFGQVVALKQRRIPITCTLDARPSSMVTTIGQRAVQSRQVLVVAIVMALPQASARNLYADLVLETDVTYEH